MKEYLSNIFLAFAIIIITEAGSKDSIATSAISSNLSPLGNSYHDDFQPESNLENPQTLMNTKLETTTIQNVRSVLKRTLRDVRIPSRPNNRNVKPHALTESNHRQSPLRVFSHPKLRQGPPSEMQTQQRQYRPAFSISQGSVQQPTPQRSRFHQINNYQGSPRSQSTVRGPLRLPGKDMMLGQQTQNFKSSNNEGWQRVPNRQINAPSAPIESLHSSSSDQIYSPSINGKVINPEIRHPPRDRVVDVYHHIPVAPRPNPNIYAGIPKVVHPSNPPIQTQNPIQRQPYFKQTPPPYFVSPEPVKVPQVPHQTDFIPKNLPASEISSRSKFESQLMVEPKKSTNTYPRLPVVIPPRFTTEREYPFEHKFVQSEPFRSDAELHRNIPEGDGSRPIHSQINPNDDNDNQDQTVVDSQLHNSNSAENVPLDLIIDDKLRVIHTVEENPLNKSGTIKKYWDFRQANSGFLPHQLNTGPESFEKVISSSSPTLSDDNKKHHRQEPVGPPLPKEGQFEGGTIPNAFNGEIHLLPSHNLPETSEQEHLKFQNVSKEFYYIENGPKLNVEVTTDVNPHFMHNIARGIEHSLKISNSAPSAPANEFMKASENPLRNSDGTKAVITEPETSTDSKYVQGIPQHILNTNSDYILKDQNNRQINFNTGSLSEWDQNIKYIPADIFRKNVLVGNPSENSSPRPHETITGSYDHSIASGLYARNKAQYQKFEDSTISNAYPIQEDSETSEIQPKQYFRGPQHVTNNWTIFEEHPISISGHRRLISTSLPHLDSWLSNPTTAIPLESITRYLQKDEKPSINAHRQVINALHLANKVFGRKNYTRKYPTISSTTTKPEYKRLKFTYSPLPRTTTESLPEVSSKFGSKRFFNFRTGATDNEPQSISSTEMNSASNDPRDPVEFIVADGFHTANSSTKQPNNRINDSMASKPSFGLERINRRRNQSALNENKRQYYINLKPVTRPYSSSTTTNLLVTGSLERQKPTEPSTRIRPVSLEKQESTEPSTRIRPVSLEKQEPTEPSIRIRPISLEKQKPTKSFASIRPVKQKPTESSTNIRTVSLEKQKPTESFTSIRPSISTVNINRKFEVNQKQTFTTKPREITFTVNRNKHVMSSSPATSTFNVISESETPTSRNVDSFTTVITKEATTGIATDEYRNHTELDAVETKVGKYHIQTSPTSSTSSSSSTELTMENVNQERMFVDSLKSMKMKMQEMMSKGMRHLMPMIMDLSSDVTISSDCTFSLLRWLRGVRTLEQWAIRMMDASSKVPEGILFGTFSTFGSYDECIAIKTPKTNMQIPYTGQYCSINIQPALPENERHFTIQNAFRRYPKLKKVFQEMNIDEDTMAYYYILKHRMGLCIPSTCGVDDLENVTDKLSKQLMMKISVGHCETSVKPSFTKGQIISMCGVFIAFSIVVIATILDFFLRHRLDHDMDIEEIVRKNSSLRQFSYSFSAYRNACKILNTSIPSNHLSSLHGIKFLSITWIMLGHVYYCKDYLTLAGLNRVRDLGTNLAFQVVLNTAFAADTFFFLSGLLVVYSTFQYLENSDGKFSIVGFYLKRYCRLTPAFLMISGIILLGPLAGSGPIWNETLEPFVTGCQNYWWTNLFYFSNFVPTANTCVPHGWFLSCDMQFYLISPVIILGLYRRPKMGLLLIALGIITSMVSTGFLTFIYTLPPVSLFSLPDPKDINEYLDTMGYKPYAHYAPYCIGMATGFLLSTKQKISISRYMQILGWSFTIITCTLVVYGTWDWNSGNLPDWSVSVAYATSSRTVWSLGIAWLTVVCYTGYGGTINDILSWHAFIPLSRLSYLAYLIHPLLMYLYASYVRSPFYFSQYVLVYLYFGHVCVTFGLAFLFSLAFELPFLNLEKIVSRRLDQNRRKRRASFSHHHTNWQHPEYPEIKDSVVLMRRRTDLTHR